MTPIEIMGWSAWAPRMTTRAAWQCWLRGGEMAVESIAKPPNKRVPPMLRRRCTLNTRMALETAFAVCEEQGIDPAEPHLFLGTANGETSSLKVLLEDLSRDERLSPTAFTNSVHHVPTGYFSIAAQHVTVSRTLSAFDDTLICTFLDMLGLLARRPERPALLMFTDEVSPEPFDQMLEIPPFPFAVSLLVRACPDQPGAITLSREESGVEAADTSPSAVFSLLRWYDGGAPTMRMQTAFGAVLWQRR